MLVRKAPSRLRIDSGRRLEASCSPRIANRVNPPPRTITRKPSSAGPTPDWVKLCTDAMTEDRVSRVARMVMENVASTSTKFHACSIPRFTWSAAEWMKAVARSQGIRAAFSTGSHAQYPPQPSTS